VLPRTVRQFSSPASAFGQTQKTGICKLTTSRILLDPLSGLTRGAFHVEQVVGNLKEHTKAPAKVIQTF
jgi:hypothetical protein